MDQPNMPGPFYNAVNLLAKRPRGSNADVQNALQLLTQAQKDALFSGDWGRVQQAIKAENPKLAALANPDSPWDLFQFIASATELAASIATP